MSNDWIKWNGDACGYIGGRPVAEDTFVDVIFRNGSARTNTADDFNWWYAADSTDEADIVSYRISEMQSPQMTMTNPHDSGKPCLCFPGQCRGQVVDGKQPNGDRCKEDYAKSDEAWFDWDASTLPTHPGTAGRYRMEWTHVGIIGISYGCACDPAWTLPRSNRACVERYRWTDPRVMVLNPYTGQKRNAVDIMQDPEGKLVRMASDVPMIAVKLSVQPGDEIPLAQERSTKFLVSDPTVGNAPSKRYDENCVAIKPGIDESFAPTIVRGSATVLVNGVDVSDKVNYETASVRLDKPEEDDFELIDSQFNSFMQGVGASEDHDDMRKALLSLGLAEGTVTKMMTALANGEVNRQRIEATAAIRTLVRMGYTYTHGAVYWKSPIGNAPAFSAPDLLDAAAGHMRDRAKTYDKPEGERSMGATVEAFNAITGRDLRESEGWLLMTLLKLVRSETRDSPHRDSVEDGVSYVALYGEARLGGV